MVDLNHFSGEQITSTDVLLVCEDPVLIRKTRELFDLTDKHRFSMAVSPHRQGVERARQIKPDLVILDVHFENSDPLNVVKFFRTELPELPLLLLSMDADAILAERALRAGANGFVVRDAIETDLLAATECLLNQQSYASEDVMQEILRGMMEAPQEATSLSIDLLSDREVVVFRFLGQGHTIREIADELDVNVKTVATHCKNIRKKLHVNSNKNLALAGTRWLETIRKNPMAEPETSRDVT